MPHNIDSHKPVGWTFTPLPPELINKVQDALRERLMEEITDQFCLPQRLFFPGGFPCQHDMNYSSMTGSLAQLVNSSTGG